MKETNNKGFSLVELVIVIAIMAVLVVVIAPQYTKFVKQARVSTDIQTAGEAATAINVAVAMNKAPFTAPTGVSETAVMTSVYASKVEGLQGKAPLSKLGGTWEVVGNDDDGVTKIYLIVDSKYYEAWPNTSVRNTTCADKDTADGLEALNN